MRLDNTHIAIRERGIRELFDLALVVTRHWAAPLAMALAIGAAPLAAINHCLLSGVLYASPLEEDWASYTTCMALLVFFESPLATSLVGVFLGQAMFAQHPSLIQAARDVLPRAGQLAWYGLVVRGVVPAWLMLAMLTGRNSSNGAVGLLIMLSFYVGLVRGLRPFLFEVILLERNPWRGGDGHLTTARRSKALHQPSGGELFGHFVLSITLAVVMVLGLWLTLWYLRAHLTNHVDFADMMFIYLSPLSMWLVAGYLSVVRFLSYLDLRIRHEGWEVELRMRAEGAQLARQLGT